MSSFISSNATVSFSQRLERKARLQPVAAEDQRWHYKFADTQRIDAPLHEVHFVFYRQNSESSPSPRASCSGQGLCDLASPACQRAVPTFSYQPPTSLQLAAECSPLQLEYSSHRHPRSQSLLHSRGRSTDEAWPGALASAAPTGLQHPHQLPAPPRAPVPLPQDQMPSRGANR